MIAMLQLFNSSGPRKAPLPRAAGPEGLLRFSAETMLVAGGTAWEGGVKLFLNDTQVYDVRANKWRARSRANRSRWRMRPFRAVGDLAGNFRPHRLAH
jgi:hypothetical protein